jgi:UDP-2,3-diacylglucosamine pyrophosphatase LpxH
VRLFYIPGNHDEFLRDYYGTHFGGIEVLEDAIHVAADGKRYLVIHGDLFDVIIRGWTRANTGPREAKAPLSLLSHPLPPACPAMRAD